MNNIEEAKKWFRDLFMGCYLKKLDKYPNSIFWIYDKNLIRQRKLSKITGIEKINLEMSDGELIFEQNERNGYFYIKYNDYWLFLKSNFNLDTKQVNKLTNDVVNEVLKCNQYTTFHFYKTEAFWMNEVLNCKQYTTKRLLPMPNCMVNEIISSNEYKIN